jgi:hypothetical protein
MNERFFYKTEHNHLLSPFLFVFVGPAERCGLKNSGSVWHVAATGVQTFQKKGKQLHVFGDVEWMLTQSG